MINIYYTVMSIYGWVLWKKSSEDQIHVEVFWTTKKEWMIAAILFVLSVILVLVIYYYKPLLDNNFISENVQYGFHHLDWANWMDIFTTSVFLVGMWLMAKRRIESCAGRFICLTLDSLVLQGEIQRRTANLLQEMIMGRIHPYGSLDSWIAANTNVGPAKFSRAFIEAARQHRIKWIDLLIKEFTDLAKVAS